MIVEATGNAAVVVDIPAPTAARVIVTNPQPVQLIARAKTRTDQINARVLAQLYAAGALPEVWITDAVAQARRRQVTLRNQLVKNRVRLKAIVQSILHANLVRRRPRQDIFGARGRAWVLAQDVPPDEQAVNTWYVEDV